MAAGMVVAESAAMAYEAAASEWAPPRDDAFELLGYEPICLPRHEASKRGAEILPEPCGQCPQELFHSATEDDVLYGGSAGGGKTAAIVAEALRACTRHPGIRVLILRRSYDELAESIYPEFQRFAWGEALGGKLNKTEKEVTFPNRSLIRLRYMETLDDASRRQGGAYQLVFVDERTLLAPGIVDVIALERLRSAHGVPVIGIRSTSNPGGPGHGEVRARYIDPTEHGRKVVTDEQGLTVRFIPAKATDNPFLDEAYFRRLDAIPDPARRAAMRDGDWGQFAGQMFPELRWDRHTVDPFTLPASWRRYSTVDWGYSKPWAVLWGAVDEDGRAWAYREIYDTQVGEAEQARRILAAEADGEHMAARLADDAMWATRGDAKPISQVYADNGVHLAPAGKGPGSRVAGWQRVHSYLAEGPACLLHRAMGWQTCPMIHFFRTLPKMWWELANLPHARRGDPEDADSNAPDHLCLAAGTLVATERGQVPIERVVPGDRVWTRQGLRTITAAGMTSPAARTGTVRLSDGTVLRGTAGHPVWVAGQGWTTMDALRYSDIVATWPAARVSCSTGSPSAATPTRNGAPTGFTSPRAAATARGESGGFTRRSGRRRTGRSLRAATSTTRTRIRSTTTSPTWSASRAGITSSSTWPSGTSRRRSGSPTWRRSGPSPRNGIAAMRAASGIASTAGAPGKDAGQVRTPARSAGKPLSPARPRRTASTARTTAATGRAWSPASMTRTGTASFAGRRSGSTSTCGSASAPVRVLRGFLADNGRRDVYNLTVDGAHEFYANGVLVHNCDTLRYWLLNLGGGAEAWLEWARRKAMEAAAARGEGPAPEPRPGAVVAQPAALPEPELEPVPLDPVTARKLARDAAYRAQRG